VIDFTTSRPSLAATIARAAAERGVLALDAPVSRRRCRRARRLSIMVGGEKKAFNRGPAAFALSGKTIVHQDRPAGVSTRKWSTKS